MVGRSRDAHGMDAPIPPPFSLVEDPDQPTGRTGVRVYRPHRNISRYGRISGILMGLLVAVGNIVWTGASTVIGVLSGDSPPSLPYLVFVFLLPTIIYVVLFVVFWPKMLKGQKVTLTDRFLRIYRPSSPQMIAEIPRSSISQVHLKDGWLLRRHGLRTLRLVSNATGVPWWIRINRGRVNLMGLDRPGHLRRQLLEQDGADEVAPLDERSVVTLEQETPTWTRHS